MLRIRVDHRPTLPNACSSRNKLYLYTVVSPHCTDATPYWEQTIKSYALTNSFTSESFQQKVLRHRLVSGPWPSTNGLTLRGAVAEGLKLLCAPSALHFSWTDHLSAPNFRQSRRKAPIYLVRSSLGQSMRCTAVSRLPQLGHCSSGSSSPEYRPT